MIIAHDVYSETNPGFCACVLTVFATAYVSINSEGLELPIAYLSLPIALSGDLGASFNGTNRKTGLREWFERNAQNQINLSERLNASMNIVSEAIRFGCFANILTLDNDSRLKLGSQSLKKSVLKSLHEENLQIIKRAERLGYWFANAGSTRTCFNIMGLTV